MMLRQNGIQNGNRHKRNRISKCIKLVHLEIVGFVKITVVYKPRPITKGICGGASQHAKMPKGSVCVAPLNYLGNRYGKSASCWLYSFRSMPLFTKVNCRF